MPATISRPAQRWRLRVTGVVQGVGFRPFVHALAVRHRLTGFVRNDGGGVTIEVEGAAPALERFVDELRSAGPPAACIDTLTCRSLEPTSDQGFAIVPSDAAPAATPALVAPDIATCDACLRELFDPGDRRHRYAFITCAHCGPRYTIAERVPYDRANTTMARFPMCDECRAEYDDPSDRRFHAETIACRACGPRLTMPFDEAAQRLTTGQILAVKGLGGYHLACLAADEDAVARLRARKQRDAKPFAVLTARPHDLAELEPAEEALLHSPARPIVLVRRRLDAPLAGAVAPGTPWIGLLAPYTPLHHLLCHDVGAPLVFTSANRSDEPIAVEDDEARRRLAGIADAVLAHDRPIRRRCEDSVVRAGSVVRRSRGYVPGPLELPVPARRPIVATGGLLKSTFCVVRDSQAFLSAHLGDLDDPRARRAFGEELERELALLGVEPAAVACDLHPDYPSTRWALEQPGELVRVQHHHAHAAACLAEHGLEGPALALVLDGTGYGPDGTLWGGELLRCDLQHAERVAHLEPIPLPGGEAAVREPWRVAAAYLERAGRPVPFERWQRVRASLRVNAPLSSGMGRLFDAVAALLGVCREARYEGQAAIELEQLAGAVAAAPYRCRVEDGLIRGGDLVAAAHDDLRGGRPREQIAAAFHEGVAAAAVRVCEQAAEPRTVALSGGTFQNLRLSRAVRRGLQAAGFAVLEHRRVPANDGGLSYGQAAVAARKLSAPCA